MSNHVLSESDLSSIFVTDNSQLDWATGNIANNSDFPALFLEGLSLLIPNLPNWDNFAYSIEGQITDDVGSRIV